MFTNRFGNFFDDLFNDTFLMGRNWPRRTHYPQVNVWKGDKGLLLTARVPGVKSEELDIAVKGHTLTISAERENEFSFSRSFELPIEVENDKIEANLKDGILELSLPAAKSAEPKKITVKC